MVASGGAISPTHTKKGGDPSSPGAPDTEDPLLLSIASKQSTLVQPLITLTLYIPSTSVGAVIGRKGSTIAQIQRQAQQVGTSNGPVRLSIVGHQTDGMEGGDGGKEHTPLSPTASPHTGTPTAPQPVLNNQSSVPYTYSELDWSSPYWTPVVIRADPCATLTAARLLRAKVGQLDDVIMDVPLGRAKHAAVVGRRGYVLANLSADHNVRIMVPRRELRHDVVQLEGALDQVIPCLERVLSIASSETNTTGTTPGATTAVATTGNTTTATSGGKKKAKEDSAATTTVVVTVSALPSQTKLRTVGRKTDTVIKKKKVDDTSWDLTVSGVSPENVQAAANILKKWTEDNNNDQGENKGSKPKRQRRKSGKGKGNNRKGGGGKGDNNEGGDKAGEKAATTTE